MNLLSDIFNKLPITFFLLGLFINFNLLAETTLEERVYKIKNFPCMQCHGNISHKSISPQLKRPHDQLIFKHMESIKNCYKCHDKKDRDRLVLQTGEFINFNESHKLCFQCHGEKKRDWELGMHGKMVGSWNGNKYKYTCTNCHEPHHPKFRKMKADPAPKNNNDKNNAKGAH